MKIEKRQRLFLDWVIRTKDMPTSNLRDLILSVIRGDEYTNAWDQLRLNKIRDKHLYGYKFDIKRS